MKLTVNGNGQLIIDTPYNPDFVKRVKVIGARWDGSKKVWTTDERNIDVVRAAMREVYGMDDRPAKLVSVRVTLAEDLEAFRAPVMLFGRAVASAFGRDSGAKVGDGVAFEAGAPKSGGSVKNWYTYIPAGAVILIHDVPETAIQEQLDWDDANGTFEVVTNATIDRVALAKEKEAILARLAEIDALLAQTDGA